MLWQTGSGFAGVAMTALMDRDGFLASQSVAADGETPFANPLAPKQPHFEPKAKNVIFLYMYGGPSQVDTFDYKPSMYGMDGKTIEVKTFGRGGHRNQGESSNLAGSSSNTVSVANGSVISFQISAPAQMTSLSFIR
jgi:hypothetical protein